MGQKHIHADLIKAWADGAEIEFYDPMVGLWLLAGTPLWHQGYRYRIKPQPKPDIGVVTYVTLSSSFWGATIIRQSEDANVKFIFDADTEKLKAVEIIK